MTSPPPHYARLTRSGVGLFRRSSAWLGTDHVLVVSVSLATETYRRFFFRDIQAIVVRPTTRRTTINNIFLALGALNLLPMMTLLSSDPYDHDPAWFALGSVVWFGAAITNALLGPTCETWVRTAVQEDRVDAFGRHRTTVKAIERLRPLISAAQAAETQPAQSTPA